MKKQIEFRKGILSKEWEHAEMKMKLRHMEQELYTYQRQKVILCYNVIRNIFLAK